MEVDPTFGSTLQFDCVLHMRTVTPFYILFTRDLYATHPGRSVAIVQPATWTIAITPARSLLTTHAFQQHYHSVFNFSTFLLRTSHSGLIMVTVFSIYPLAYLI